MGEPAENFPANLAAADSSEELTLRRKSFYDDFADTKVRLVDGKVLRFSKDQLFKSTKSSVLRQLFDGDLREEVTDILDVKFDTFKLFLDCLIGLEPYTEENSRELFPVAWKYQVDECLDEIYKALTPTEVNTNICHSLNMAMFYECKKLHDEILWSFLIERHRYRNLLEKEEYYNLLSVESFEFLMGMIGDFHCESVDSYVIDIMFKWAENYLKKNNPNQPIDIVQFLENTKLDEYILPSAFETTGSIIRFCKSPLGKGYFSEDDIPNLLQQSFLVHADSKWFVMNAGETITEKYWARVPFYKNSESLLSVCWNNAIFYDGPEDDDPNQTIVTCTIEIQEDGQTFEFAFTDASWEWNTSETINISSNVNEVKKINLIVRWTFRYPCRILKTSQSTVNFGEGVELKLYFTKEAPEWFDSKMNVRHESESEEEENEDEDEHQRDPNYYRRLQTILLVANVALLLQSQRRGLM